MKVDMSPKAIENRLKLVGELTKACLLIRQNSLEDVKEERKTDNFEDYSSEPYKRKISKDFVKSRVK